MAINNDIFAKLNGILSKTNFEDVTAESSGFEDLPEGYYLCEVEKAELKESKSSGEPMASFQFNVIDNGISVEFDDDNAVHMNPINKSKGRKIFKNFVLKDESSVRRFATDMLKFEGETPGESILPKEAFMSGDTLEDALDLTVGLNIYIQVTKTTKADGSASTWNNFISWKRAAALELPV